MNKIKLAFISPTKWITTLGSQGDFQLGLAHLLDRHQSNDYERALLDTGQQIILDNSLFELHKPEGIDSLIAKGLRIKATHFFAPDFLYNKDKTLEALNNTIYIWKKLRADKNIKIAAVVQGETEEEWLEMYDKLQEMPEVDLIGLSILSVPRCFGSFNRARTSKKDVYQHKDEEITSSRIKLLKTLITRNKPNNKKCHLLGLGSSLEDIIFATKNCPFVVSHDSSSAIWSGFQNKKLLDDGLIEGGKSEIKVDFNYLETNKEQIQLAQENINKYKSLLC